ncbi:MAG TPA: type II secretion system protein [Myxococcota bacterium]|jgi:prepilin-type N-terminal cleavage/methylation domain-containing protein
MRSLRGFSLIEMMVVVAILAIAASLAVPRLLPEIHKARLDGDAEIVANFVSRARSEAMYQHRCTQVRRPSATQLVSEVLNSFDCDSNPATIKIDTTTALFLPLDSITPSTKTTYTLTLPVDGNANGAPNVIRFRPNGRVWGTDSNLANDFGLVTVTNTLLQTEINNTAGTHAVLVQGNGLICVLPRGTTGVSTCP